MQFKTLVIALLCSIATQAQPSLSTNAGFKNEKKVAITPIKNQWMTGTCWCFSTTSLVESQCLKNGKLDSLDLSEMFVVRNIYLEKAKNYVLRLGHAQFGEGGLGHDMIRATGLYGAMPESVYSGLLPGQKGFNHVNLSEELKKYLDSIVANIPIANDWLVGFIRILDKYMGTPPAEFDYAGKSYTPQRFATEYLRYNADDYISLTSFTHQPFYKPFILQVPDNFSNGSFYNLPLNELTQVVKEAVEKGYSVMWDADVSNKGFHQEKGLALFVDEQSPVDVKKLTNETEEAKWDPAIRQGLYENLTTQDDHLMHIYGTAQSTNNKLFFLVKNSWGKMGPFSGSIYVSESYFAINTVSIVVPKAALNASLLSKLLMSR